jgi:SAM-dependent methyltransferase
MVLKKIEMKELKKDSKFDKYAENYNLLLKKETDISGYDVSYFAEYKIKLIKKNIINRPQKILDYGCGIGRNLEYLTSYFPDAEIYGCDISEESIKSAASNAPDAHLFLLGKDEIKEKFDLILMTCVMHHIAPVQRNVVLNDISDILNNKGEFFIFEHNPYNPLTRRIVNNCVYDEDAVLIKPVELKKLLLLAGFDINDVKYVLFFPGFLKFLQYLENFLYFVPLGGQYFMHSIKK